MAKMLAVIFIISAMFFSMGIGIDIGKSAPKKEAAVGFLGAAISFILAIICIGFA